MQRLFMTDEKARELLAKYGSPLYVYDEGILRKCCRDMRSVLPEGKSHVSYSVKANNVLQILRIVHDEGLFADTMSPGEIFVCEKAGFTPDEMFFVSNNVSVEEMRYATERGIVISLDSLSQLETFGKNFPGHKVSVRINTEFGDGHHEKVITAGKKTKFGVQTTLLGEMEAIIKKYDLVLVGLNQHIGSLVLDPTNYFAAADMLVDISMRYPTIEFLDFGGGFGVPYRPDEPTLDLDVVREKFKALYEKARANHPNGKNLIFKSEPGRYIVAESGVLLGTVNAIKENHDKTYIGTDVGFNALMRPILYESYHHIVFPAHEGEEETIATVTGNICESGDILAKDRPVTMPKEGDVMAILTAGAYGYAMASSYNCRRQPAEVMLMQDGTDKLIRRRETFEELIEQMI